MLDFISFLVIYLRLFTVTTIYTSYNNCSTSCSDILLFNDPFEACFYIFPVTSTIIYTDYDNFAMAFGCWGPRPTGCDDYEVVFWLVFSFSIRKHLYLVCRNDIKE